MSVVVIGAGVAGLAAAGRLRELGAEVTLIEAGPRIGGRAWTTALAGAPFDHGAAWLHDAHRNPLVRAGEVLIDSDRAGRDRLSLGGRVATAEEAAAYAGTWDRLDDAAAPALAGADVSLATAMQGMAGDPWAKLVALWEGPIIAAADADRLSLQDWRRNRLDGRNMVPAEGVGAYVARLLATEVRLRTPATRVVWDGTGVRVETPAGVIAADAAIVTVSTGVLAGNGIGFQPPLPDGVLAAVHALPMGLATKVVFTGADRLGLEDGTRVADRDGGMVFYAWPYGRPHLIGFVGGQAAWDVVGDAAAAEALAREELARALGADAVRRLGPAAAVTDWGSDPSFAGAYAYAGPGDADARGALAEACPGERLVFAGEAVRVDGLAGTVGGAFMSGVAAAERVVHAQGTDAGIAGRS